MKQRLSSLLLLISLSPSLLLAEQPLTPEQAREVYHIPVPIAQGPFSADWKSFSADKLKQEPDWWRDAKIGIWFHWGPQSMGRNGDWYARFLYQQPSQGRQGRANGRYMYDVHLQRFGHPSEFGYMDVLNAWKASKFDPKHLLALYEEAGARYILVQGAHHDNFDLWNSKFQPWNSVNVGPKRDIVGEMFAEARKRRFHVGMAFHADYSLWWYQPAFGSDKTGPKAGVPYDAAARTKENGKGQWWQGLDPKDLYGIDLSAEALPGKDIRDGFITPVNDLFLHAETRQFAKEYCLKWFNRLREFVDDYDPDFLYTDGTEPFTGQGTAKGVISDACVKVVAHMYNKRYAKNNGSVDCMAVIKGGPRIPGIASPRENGYTGPILREAWVWENTVGEWFFEENTFYDSRSMIFQMIEAISRDGNFNMNISLTPEGELEPGAVRMWRDFGEFTRRNAAAIYGSRAWKILGEDAASVPVSKPVKNVTSQVQSRVKNGVLDLDVGSVQMGIADPFPGVSKKLELVYEQDGKCFAATGIENKRLQIGTAGAKPLNIVSATFGPAKNSVFMPRSFPADPIVKQHADFAMATSDVRFTQGKDGAIYAFIMAVPKPGETLTIKSLGTDAGLLNTSVGSVELLGSPAKLQWRQEANGLVIQCPSEMAFPFAVVFKIGM